MTRNGPKRDLLHSLQTRLEVYGFQLVPRTQEV